MVSRLTPVDLLLVEGFKRHAHPKLEVHRPSLGKPPLWPDDPETVAVASDAPVPGLRLPWLCLGDPGGIAQFILGYIGLA
jgi:molybdopterin-guanine dinucleotide biosynthesis protein B